MIALVTLLAETNNTLTIGGSLIAFFISVAIGGFIGSMKNRMGLGLLLGIFGCIGWLIIALIPKKEVY
jgi:hypothetical protein